MRKEFLVSIHLFPFFSTPELNNTWSVAQAAIPNYGSSNLSLWSLNYPHGLWHCRDEDRTWKKRGPTCCDLLNYLARHVHISKEILLRPSQQFLLLLPSVQMVARQGLLFQSPKNISASSVNTKKSIACFPLGEERWLWLGPGSLVRTHKMAGEVWGEAEGISALRFLTSDVGNTHFEKQGVIWKNLGQ